MEAILISTLAQYLIPALGVIITGLVGYGISMLKKKTNSDIAKNALDEVDRIVGAVVGSVAQVSAKRIKAAAKDGHLSQEERDSLKTGTIRQVEFLISEQVAQAAEQSVPNLNRYIQNKIEERVLAQKK